MSTSYQISSPRHDAAPITLRACRRSEGAAEPAIDVCVRYPHEQARSSFVIGRSGEITVVCRVKQDPQAALSAAATQLLTRAQGEPLRHLAAAHGRLSRGVATLTSRIVSHALGLERDLSKEQFAALLPPSVCVDGHILAAPQRAAAAASAALNTLATAAIDPASLRLGHRGDPLASAAAAASVSEFPAVPGGIFAQRSRIAATVGPFGLPVTGGWLSSRYGWREARKKFHKGIDIAVEENTPVVAAQAGRISFAGWRKGYGYVVVVDHGKGYSTLYAHCNRFVARKVEAVGKGQAIALSGNTGHSTGPHLHFEIHRHGSPVDPLLLLPAEAAGTER
ncbi:unnamed protein product [Closterium sp. Naga37s-1]|nr:unnamed protein product [Closterium sp. Naga37s-1]